MAAWPEVKAVMFLTTLASRGLQARVAALRVNPPRKPFFAGIAAGHAALRG